MLRSWRAAGAVVRDESPALWELAQEYRTADGVQHVRRGFLARVRVQEYGPGTIRPHERTHPGPREDRLRLTRATRTNLSPIFALLMPTWMASGEKAPDCATSVAKPWLPSDSRLGR